MPLRQLFQYDSWHLIFHPRSLYVAFLAVSLQHRFTGGCLCLGSYVEKITSCLLSAWPLSTKSNISSCSIQLCSPLLCFARCCSAQGGQTNKTFPPTFLDFRDLSDVNRRPAFVFKLFHKVRFRNCVQLSVRQSNKLDKVTQRIQHLCHALHNNTQNARNV